MRTAQTRLDAVKEGEPLAEAPGLGYVFPRRRKHEWRDDLVPDAKDFELQTSDKRGSKFNQFWTLDRQVGLMIGAIAGRKYQRGKDQKDTYLDLREPIGWSAGREVNFVCLEITANAVHCYPIDGLRL